MTAGISAVRYGGDFGFIGLYIAAPEFRGKGHGRRVWDAGMAHLAGRTIGLDGVPEQQPSYRSMGFATDYDTYRWSGCFGGAVHPMVQPLTRTGLAPLLAFDRNCFPAERSAFLRSWLQPPRRVLLFVEDGELRGYAVSRPCLDGHKIGPLFAVGIDVAAALLHAVAADLAGETLHLDVPAAQAAFSGALEGLGFSRGFRTSRMYKGTAPLVASNGVFAVTTLELGRYGCPPRRTLMDSSATSPHPAPAAPTIERIKHELKRRQLIVRAIDYVTPQMLRVTLADDSLSDFVSAAADDHIKLFIPGPGSEPEMRDYTPRRYSNDERTLVVDFAVHEAGPATQWALEARPGTPLTIGGPRGSAVIRGVSKWVLVGDETALPAIGRRIEEASSGETMTCIVAVASKSEEQSFDTEADLRMHWIHRPLANPTDASGIIAALEQVELTDDTFVWVAAEATVARAVRSYLVEARAHPLQWIKAAGYWALGRADSHERIGD
eukprot:g25168.t1